MNYSKKVKVQFLIMIIRNNKNIDTTANKTKNNMERHYSDVFSSQTKYSYKCD